MFKLPRTVAGWVLVMSLAAGAQSPTSTGLIVGRVVDADSGAGVAGVLVTLSPVATAPSAVGELLESRAPVEGFSPTANPAVRRTLTAADGRFVFGDLAKGRFNIFATSPRYAPGSYGQLRPQGPATPVEIGDTERIGTLSIRLWRYGSISGAVRDESGEPAAGVSLECSRRVISGGQRRYAVPSAAPVTDDRGMYRVSNLPPGDYLCGYSPNSTTMPASIAAGASMAGETSFAAEESRRMLNSASSAISSGFRIGDFIYSNGASTLRGPLPPVASDGRMVAYAHQYFSGASSTSQATLITLKAGEDRTAIDIQLRLTPAVRITGKLHGPDGTGSFLGVRLVPASGNDMVSEGQAEFSRTITDASGSFAFLGVPAGQYVIKSRMFPRPAAGGNLAAALDEMSLWVATPITVGDTDVLNLAVPVRAGIRVTGRLEFSGSNQPTPAQIQRITVRMQGAEGRTSSPIPLDGRVAADATFKTAGYPAGRYIGNVLPNTIPPGWHVKSMMLNGRDISVDPLDLTENDVGGVTISFTDKSTSLTGAVSGPKGPDGTAEVIVFPADSIAWKEIGVVARRFRAERVSSTGKFSIAGLPPGDYFVTAIAGSVPGDRQDPALLTTLARDAARVTLTDGASASVQVTVKR